MPEPMRIKCAAIRYQGRMYLGRRHCEIGCWMVANGICPQPYPGGEDQGFATECGRFVRRAPAKAIARRAGQITRERAGNALYSEDMNIPEMQPQEGGTLGC